MKIHQSDSKEKKQLARKIEFLDRPERIKSLPPEELLKMLPIKKNRPCFRFRRRYRIFINPSGSND